MKNIISHHKLSDLLGNMTEVQALTGTDCARIRDSVEGKVQEQWIWKH